MKTSRLLTAVAVLGVVNRGWPHDPDAEVLVVEDMRLHCFGTLEGDPR
ncbi:hypothetical protein [Actinoplanes sp. NPDC051494]